MKYRQVGRSSLSVSEITFGTGDNGGGMIYSSAREQQALAELALELGVNTFDTSPDYGKGAAEANLGRTLQELGAKDAQIITKVEIMPEDLGRVGDKIRESVNDSLLRLRRDYVDVLMLHNPCRMARDTSIRQWTPLTPADVLNEVLPALEGVKQSGKARYLGLACETADTEAVRLALASGRFTLIHVWYNLANPSAAYDVGGMPPRENYRGLIQAAAEHGAGVAVIRPLAGGALTDTMLAGGHDARDELSRGYLRDVPQAFEPELKRAAKMSFLSQPGRQKLSEAAYRFILANETVATVIGGYSRAAHLEEAAKCSDQDPMRSEELREVERAFASAFAQ